MAFAMELEPLSDIEAVGQWHAMQTSNHVSTPACTHVANRCIQRSAWRTPMSFGYIPPWATLRPVLVKYTLLLSMKSDKNYRKLYCPMSRGFRPNSQASRVKTTIRRIAEKRQGWNMDTVVAKLDTRESTRAGSGAPAIGRPNDMLPPPSHTQNIRWEIG